MSESVLLLFLVNLTDSQSLLPPSLQLQANAQIYQEKQGKLCLIHLITFSVLFQRT